MRVYIQCRYGMIKYFEVKVESGGYRLKIPKGTDVVTTSLVKPKAALCRV